MLCSPDSYPLTGLTDSFSSSIQSWSLYTFAAREHELYATQDSPAMQRTSSQAAIARTTSSSRGLQQVDTWTCLVGCTCRRRTHLCKCAYARSRATMYRTYADKHVARGCLCALCDANLFSHACMYACMRACVTLPGHAAIILLHKRSTFGAAKALASSYACACVPTTGTASCEVNIYRLFAA